MLARRPRIQAAEEDALARLTGDEPESRALLLRRPERAERSSELVYFPPVLAPVSSALGRDCAVVMRLGLSEELGYRG